MNNKYQLHLSTLLLFMVGFINTIIFIYCGKALVAFMGGNIAEFSAGIVDLDLFHVLRGAFIILAYVAGSFFGTLIRVKSNYYRPLIIILNMILVAISLLLITNNYYMETVYIYAFVMGNQSAILINYKGVILSQGFSTGLLAQVGEGYALWATKQIEKTSVLLHTYKFIMMVIGGVIGGLLTFSLSFFTTGIVIFGLYLIILIYMYIFNLHKTERRVS